jgi:hypothetical protein
MIGVRNEYFTLDAALDIFLQKHEPYLKKELGCDSYQDLSVIITENEKISYGIFSYMVTHEYLGNHTPDWYLPYAEKTANRFSQAIGITNVHTAAPSFSVCGFSDAPGPKSFHVEGFTPLLFGDLQGIPIAAVQFPFSTRKDTVHNRMLLIRFSDLKRFTDIVNKIQDEVWDKLPYLHTYYKSATGIIGAVSEPCGKTSWDNIIVDESIHQMVKE